MGVALVHPGGSHRADELLEHLGRRPVRLDEGEDDLGVDGHLGLVAVDVVAPEELLVVGDDPVVDPRHVAVANGVVVRGDRRVPLRVVADVHQRLARRGGDEDGLEQGARSRLLLVHLERPLRAVRVADGVCAALGDPGEQRLRGQRPVHP